MEERINSGRQKELDYAKGLAILFMILVHCLEVFSTYEVIDETTYGRIVEFFGSFTSATVFMILLGVGIVYSKKAEPTILIKRGLMLIIAAYFLNICRGVIPMLISWKISQSDEWIPYIIIEAFRIDILQFAGLTFVLFGLFKKLKLKTIVYVVIFIAVQISNILLIRYGFYYDDIMNYTSPGFYLAAFTGLFWGTSELSSFPLFSWIFYPVAGYLFGLMLIRLDDKGKKKIYILILISSIMIFSVLNLLCGYFGVDYGFETDDSFYHHLILGNLVFGSCAFILISLVYFIRNVIPYFVKNTLIRWSNNVTEIYIIQWVLIGWIAIVSDYNLLGVSSTLAISIIVIVLSDIISKFYKSSIKK